MFCESVQRPHRHRVRDLNGILGNNKQIYDKYSVNSTCTWSLFDFVFFTHDTMRIISIPNIFIQVQYLIILLAPIMARIRTLSLAIQSLKQYSMQFHTHLLLLDGCSNFSFEMAKKIIHVMDRISRRS
jgi:hypothetical protein